jgi:hypothetical protein
LVAIDGYGLCVNKGVCAYGLYSEVAGLRVPFFWVDALSISGSSVQADNAGLSSLANLQGHEGSKMLLLHAPYLRTSGYLALELLNSIA